MSKYVVTRYHTSYNKDIDMLCQAFSNESLKDYLLTVDAEKLWQHIAYICEPYSFFLVTEEQRVVGLISGYLTSSVTNKLPVLQELMWYVYPEHRRRGLVLLKYFEECARNLGAKSIIMALMHNSKSEKIGRYYERQGYIPVETHYMKELK